MEIKVIRAAGKEGATLGSLFLDNVFECFTLEDQVRETALPVISWKIPGETAIPRGRYQVTADMSTRFQRVMPHILNVPGFDGVRIHSGNTAADTEGCILLGRTKEANLIYQSKAAFASFFPKLQAALAKGPVYISII